LDDSPTFVTMVRFITPKSGWTFSDRCKDVSTLASAPLTGDVSTLAFVPLTGYHDETVGFILTIIG
jgi:hypothetical protein